MADNNQKTVVIVDDSTTLARLFERAILDMDVLLEIFDKTSEASEYLEDNKPDLIFMNIKMPGKDGLATLKDLRKKPLHDDTPVVMISSKDYAQDRSIAKELGAIEFITKPMPIQVIKDALIAHLNF
ncbi:MAG: response regulator [Gammaproteobacteria bacterium]|nr:response regulator [Gammaproteobacteria bacterium]